MANLLVKERDEKQSRGDIGKKGGERFVFFGTLPIIRMMGQGGAREILDTARAGDDRGSHPS
ncbi:hypothetical protein [Bartonella sp. B1098]|uniref:hypothetical protein n=1 Tax=Bartonella sp. B1098 TaxID=2911421 RepID=UPI0020C1CE5B|nr:hypothetical protein [Bartonella sp. B1098]